LTDSRRQASVLVVDDVPDNLELLCSMLRSLGHEPRPVPNGHLALSAARSSPPDLVLLDMMMPGMDGYAVLHVLKSDRSLQHIPVIMVSALDEQDGAVRCIEAGADDYLTKPVSEMLLGARVSAGLQRKRWYDSERELLERTLTGTVALLTGILARVNHTAFDRAVRVHELMQRVATAIAPESCWEFEISAMFSQLGCLDIPAATLELAYSGQPLAPDEQARYDAHPAVGSGLIAAIPRLEGVARNVAYQHKNQDGTGFPDDGVAGRDIPLGARALRAVLGYDAALVSGASSLEALGQLAEHLALYDGAILEALERVVLDAGYEVRAVPAAGLVEGMELMHDVLSTDGEVLVAKGRRVTAIMRERLAHGVSVRQPILVRAGLPSEPSA
jgi:response regulator RpfG family c-di-GMP phosphodiesterase